MSRILGAGFRASLYLGLATVVWIMGAVSAGLDDGGYGNVYLGGLATVNLISRLATAIWNVQCGAWLRQCSFWGACYHIWGIATVVLIFGGGDWLL